MELRTARALHHIHKIIKQNVQPETHNSTTVSAVLFFGVCLGDKLNFSLSIKVVSNVSKFQYLQ